MNQQRHIIQRQVIELSLQGNQQAQSMQDQFSRIYRQRIIPLIGRRCSEICLPDRLYRLETLELDLGLLDPANLEQDFVARFDDALQRELAAQTRLQEQAAADPANAHSARSQSQFELFACFVRSGSLPWWAEISRPGLLTENLDILQRESPQALAHLLAALLQNADVRLRLIGNYSDKQLAALCGCLAPRHASGLQRDFRALLQGLERASTSNPSRAVRKLFWDKFLLISGAGDLHYATLDAFYRAALQRLAAGLGLSYPDLLESLRQSFEHNQPPANRTLARRIARLTAGLQTPRDARWTALLTTAHAGATTFSETWDECLRSLPGLPAALRARLMATIQNTPADLPVRERAVHMLRLLDETAAPPRPTSLNALAYRLLDEMRSQTGGQTTTLPNGPALTEHIRQVLRAERDSVAILDEAFIRSITRRVRKQWRTEQKIERLRVLLRAMLRSTPPATTRHIEKVTANSSQNDALSVTNAGLVILWPFLERFFTHLGLLNDERQFIDDASRQRAAGLLQFVAAQDAAAPEYLLPLNKALCGLEVESVFDFGAPLLESEADECASLLTAVIAQAPVLNSMTADGFRGSFLLRAGLLSLRDGLWLLRVERQSYDLVLERFPWTWNWLKLPWLEDPICVEW